MDDADAETFRVAIRAMDRVYMAFASLPPEERRKPESRKLTGSLFDALFG